MDGASYCVFGRCGAEMAGASYGDSRRCGAELAGASYRVSGKSGTEFAGASYCVSRRRGAEMASAIVSPGDVDDVLGLDVLLRTLPRISPWVQTCRSRYLREADAHRTANVAATAGTTRL